MGRWTGSWLAGPAAAGLEPAAAYPGARLGLPRTGSGSVATLGRRLGAYAVDAVASDLVALLFHHIAYAFPVILVEMFVLTALTGQSAGMRVFGIRVTRPDGRPVRPVWVLVRTMLLALFLPAIFWDRDNRGLHDRAADAVVVNA